MPLTGLFGTDQVLPYNRMGSKEDSSGKVSTDDGESPYGPSSSRLPPLNCFNLVTSIYNPVIPSSWVAGNLPAEGAIGISFVVMTAIQAVGLAWEAGTGNAISRYLGAKERDRACIMATNGLATTLLLGTLIAIVGNIFIEPICLVAGSTETILPYAKTFVGIILLGAPFMCSSLMLNMQLRFEGEALHSMIAIMTGALINIGLEPLLIYGAGLGIAGSAISTVICQFISFCILVWQIQYVGITPLSPKWLRRPTRAMVTKIRMAVFLLCAPVYWRGNHALNEAARPFA